MIITEINGMRELLPLKKPLIHCITNPISISQCANAVLAMGGRPIMAEHPKEVEEITRTASAVMLNIGNITDVRMESIALSAKYCRENDIPFVLDIVGMACSALRRKYVDNLLNIAVPSVIKGNYSEIKALCGGYSTIGVDSENIDISEIDNISVMLARKYGTVILASGKTDIITDGDRLFHVSNGTLQLSAVTGTGCMLGAVCAVFSAVGNPLVSAAASAAVMGICGELSITDKGNGTFMTSLMDTLSTVTDSEINEKLKMEEIEFEF